ncbi:sodium:solute symporter family protein [Labilibaculum euxinus]|uniref:Sodium:solute symporter family protein n=1 Tax=Labilibaculum euxinus TaxID=2686357 RepID=A0A7M4D949_9BACT|nr:sodium:solute symporter family protein [Labilibaculum euxinus]MUP39178.1 sodium:solute symporter family protein [Labilibaculum euxinus]MVB08383.1 sodium:solute symporter family protein [Labilibaculum euxinus]
MHIIDILIFVIYMLGMLGVGLYFMKRNKSQEDYYVGGREMTSFHIGLSVVATDVGGGFSIGLGGLGFLIGLSGSWMLFTGIIGAWISAVFLIPIIYPLARKHNFLSFPEILNHFYDRKVAIIAGIISLIGYIGFTSSQVLAGAKLAAATFPSITIVDAVLLMGIVVIGYTVLGGLKAVIFTDTIQWIILMFGLIVVGIPLGFVKVGGWEALRIYLPDNFQSLTNVGFVQFINWLITIVPIWFVGMTLYQRIYASKDEKTAKKAWFIAGLFEWPVMAFMGIILGLLGRVAFEQGMFTEFGYAPGSVIDPEIGLPLLLTHIFPIGLMGLLMSSYFSAIMSTADSCLMAASGNFTTDILRLSKQNTKSIRYSQLATLVIGILAIFLATKMQNVLDLMLYSYAFMVSGLFVPVLGFLFLKKPSAKAAMYAMLLGGGTTLALILTEVTLPFGLDANFFGITLSAIVFIIIQSLHRRSEI